MICWDNNVPRTGIIIPKNETEAQSQSSNHRLSFPTLDKYIKLLKPRFPHLEDENNST